MRHIIDAYNLSMSTIVVMDADVAVEEHHLIQLESSKWDEVSDIIMMFTGVL